MANKIKYHTRKLCALQCIPILSIYGPSFVCRVLCVCFFSAKYFCVLYIVHVCEWEADGARNKALYFPPFQNYIIFSRLSVCLCVCIVLPCKQSVLRCPLPINPFILLHNIELCDEHFQTNTKHALVESELLHLSFFRMPQFFVCRIS